MGLSFGALGVMVHSASTSHVTFKDISILHRIANVVEPRSVFFSFIFVVVTIILAYLTNPSEASFRTYLTELSFRRHFSRLYDTQDSERGDQDYEISGLHTPKRRHQPTKHPTKDAILSSQMMVSATPGFHFANHASVSLRTPGLVFRSLGVLTIAAVPIAPDNATNVSLAGRITPSASEKGEATLAGNWFVGVFGKWWLGGTLRLRQQNTSSEKDDPFIAGVLCIRALGAFDCDIVSESVKSLTDSISTITGRSRKVTGSSVSAHNKQDRSRNGRRSTSNLTTASGTNGSQRSGSPPPLPKSASLPLHQTRSPQNGSEGGLTIKPINTLSQKSPLSASVNPAESAHHANPSFSSSNPDHILSNNQDNNNKNNASTVYVLDQSPIIVDILNQIKVVQDEVNESRNHLVAFQASAASTQEQLRSTLDGHREKRREEDFQRTDLKQRHKAVEESKRQAETAKRDAEKRLKVAQNARDRAANRVEQLSKDIDVLRTRIAENKLRVSESGEQANAQERVLGDQITEKRKEIKVAEDVVAALTLRAKELEAQIMDEEDALAKVQEVAKERAEAAAVQIIQTTQTVAASTSSTGTGATPAIPSLSESPVQFPLYQRRSIPQAFEPETLKTGATVDTPLITPFFPHDRYNSSANDTASQLESLGRRHSGGHMQPHTRTEPIARHHFSPFADNGLMSPSASSLIPTNLFSSLDSEDGSQPTSSPIVSPLGESYDSSRVWQTIVPLQETWNDSREILYTSPTAPFFPRTSSTSEYPSTAKFPVAEASQPEKDTVSSIASNRWFAPSSKPENGHSTTMGVMATTSNLNPDAKVFNFTRGRSYLFPSSNETAITSTANANANRCPPCVTGSDATHTSMASPSLTSISQSTNSSPSSLGTVTSTTSFLSSLLAFTPSPAEREALQRALGQSHPTLSNSVEKLSLSDHSSPSLSHSHIHRPPAPSPPQQYRGPALSAASTMGSNGSSIWGGGDLYLSGVSGGATGPPVFVPRTTGPSDKAAAARIGGAGPSSGSKKTFSLWNRRKDRSDVIAAPQGSEEDHA